MYHDLSSKIIEHTKLDNISSIPFIFIVVAEAHSDCNSNDLLNFIKHIYPIVNDYINKYAHLSEDKLEIKLHFDISKIIKKSTTEICDKFEKEPKGLKEFVSWFVYKELSKRMFKKQFFLIGIDCYAKQKQIEAINEFSVGLQYDEIKEKAPKPIKIGEERLKSKIKLLARKIWEEDTNRRLMPSHVADMIIDLWVKKPNGDDIRSNTRLVEWFKEDNTTIPTDIKLMTENKTYPRGRNSKRKREEDEARIKLIVKPYADQLIQELER